ncbi:L-seryl-tRNA(Sec) kinase isoform X2 [Cheilinus undulatus]|uniref:L-seryl-tRNA(Sec) kinase isoform X2 n=1 Tax=Cheilinus undulatus TaxID=241271 RepID=UPI001BD6113B|nr:L-seryl-tRNA(Sec) kinase isoform X2 [Cheilinus undulatus]
MAAEDPGGVSRTPVCLCVLCGLPAAGKSTLAPGVLRTAAQRGWRASVLPYDDLIPEHAFQNRVLEDNGKLQDMHTEWKSHRQAVLRCIEQFLEKPQVLTEKQGSCQINRTAWEQCIKTLMQPDDSNQDPLLFVLDDNFYYPSMRYEVYQLARKYSLGFCQVYLQCDEESCISRNQSRSKPVPTEVIVEMVQRLEPPNPQKNSWEKNSILLNTKENLSDNDIQKVMELISSAMCNPLSLVEDNTEQMEADRLKCATSVVHQADQACRRLISDTMKTARENQVPPEKMKCLAARLNESKAAFLPNLRRQLLEDAAFLQDEELDVERVVKRAIDVFDRERKEILSFITNGK